MKLLIMALLATSIASARQYIQCSSEDVYRSESIILNLDGDNSTLYLTDGVHIPTNDSFSALKQVTLVGVEGQNTVFKAEDDKTVETIKFATEFLNKYANYFILTIDFSKKNSSNSMQKSYSCFSAIYND